MSDHPLSSNDGAPLPAATPATTRSMRVFVVELDGPACRVVLDVDTSSFITFEQLATTVNRRLPSSTHDIGRAEPLVVGFYSLKGDQTDHLAVSARINRQHFVPFESHIQGDRIVALVISTARNHSNFNKCRALQSEAPAVVRQLDAFFVERNADDKSLLSPTPAFKTKKIYVRHAYALLAATIEKSSTTQNQAFVITGTPGVGKTMFLWYLLRKYCLASDVVVFDCAGMFLLVHPNGTILRGKRGNSFRGYLAEPTTKYLCDAIPGNEPLTGFFATTIVTKSPDESVIKEFAKTNPTTLIMPVWTIEELHECRAISYEQTAAETVNALFARYGGSAREIFVPNDQLLARLEAFDCIANRLTDDDLRINLDFIGKFGVVDTKENKICHKLLHVQPTTDDNGVINYERATLVPASPFAKRDLARRILTASRKSLRSLLSAAAGVPQFAAARGCLFEGYAHNKLVDGGTFKIRELSGANQRNLRSASNSVYDEIYFAVKPKQVVFDELVKTSAGVYAVPRAQNYPVIDAVMNTNQLFQMTVSGKHPIHHAKLKDILNTLTTKDKPKSVTTTESSHKDLKKMKFTTTEPSHKDLKAMQFELYFVVPEDKFDSFKKQPFTNKDVNEREVPIKQYALCIELGDALPSQ